MLLNHTSGLRASMPLYRSARSVEGAIRLIVESGWEYEGGKREIYSDLGYIILGELVSALSGEGLDSVASKRIFVPLGMTSTAYRPDSKRFSIVETEHYADRECGPGLVHDENCFFLGGVTGHAGLFSCLADIEKYVFGVMAKAGAVFPPSSYHMFFDASNLRMGGTHSYGWQLKSGDDSFGKYFHDGSIGHTGYPGTGLWMDLSAGFATILLTNRVYYGRDPTKIAVVRCRFNELACESFGE
jgi:CubicO group peptidase (beta-lactamase class C family)